MRYALTVSAAFLVVGLIIYKRFVFCPMPGRSPKRAFWQSFFLYWLPAFLAWAWLVRAVALDVQLNSPTPEILILVGASVLIEWLLRSELASLKRTRRRGIE
jgi:hypothetical protein